MKFQPKLLHAILLRIKLEGSIKRVKKLAMIAKMTAALILIATLHVSASSSAQTISYHKKNVPLENVFSSIKQQTGYVFIYSDKVIAKAKPVTIDVKNVTVEKALQEALKGQPLTFEIQGNTIVISEIREEKKNAAAESLPSFLNTPSSLLPPKVHGRVVDEKGEPVSGVSVSLKGGKTIGVTDNNGEFVLTNIDNNAILVFKAVSIETIEVKLNGRSELSLDAKTKVSLLDDVQMIAYGTTSRRLSTSSVEKIKGSDLLKQPVENPILGLEGRLPGLQITQTDGMAGGPVSVSIRGKSSLGASSEPLYIIDGVPFAHSLTNITLSNGTSAQTLGGITNATAGTSPFVSLNAEDIESIEVLKDADATAIYGSRGANGVILITTKKAKGQKTRIDLSFNYGRGQATRIPDMLNTQQYVAMRKEAFKNDGITPTAGNASDIMTWDTTRYVNWPKLLLGNTATSNDLQFRISGGGQQTQYSISSGYHKETPVVYGDMYDERWNVRANMNNRSADGKFLLALNTSYNVDNNNITTTGMGQFINTIPNTPFPLDSAGNLIWADKGISFANPLSYLKKTFEGITESSISSINASYRFSKKLELKVDGGLNFLRLTQKSGNPASSQGPPTNTGFISSAQFFNQLRRNWIIEPQATYNTNLGKAKLLVLIGGSFQEQYIEGTSTTATGYSNDALLGTPGPASTKTVSSTYTKYRYTAMFGRLTYNLYNKYLINLSWRRDGSSRFGSDKQFGNFGAVGAGWIFTEEKFMKNLSFLDYGKIRASYGITGNDRIGDYQYISTWGATSAALPYQGVSGLYPSSLANPDFAWERNRKSEIGLELGFFNDRLYVSADYYLNRTDNQLIGYSLPSQTGFTSVTANRNAIVQNTGLEFTVNSTNIKSGNFSWKSSFNISIPRNKLVAYPDFETSPYASVLAIGQPTTIRKFLAYQGIDSATGIYKLNGTNITTDRTQIRNLGQNLFGGLLNTLVYKNWSLDIFLQFVKQDGFNSILFQAPGLRVNQPAYVLNRWQNPGDMTDVQKYSTAGAAVTQYSYYANYSDARITDASFLRLKNVSLSYQFNKKQLKKLKMDNLRIFLQGQNLLTFTRYGVADPETRSITTAPLKMVAAGIQVSF